MRTQGSVDLPAGLGDYVGSPVTHAGTIFAPVSGNQGPQVWMLSNPVDKVRVFTETFRMITGDKCVLD